MSVIVHFGKRIFGIFHWLIASLRRLLCCWRRRVYDSADLLPFSVHVQQNSNVDGAFLDNWDSWDSRKSKPKSLVETQIEEYRQRVTNEISRPSLEEEASKPTDPDFFMDMQPEYKKSKKILLKQKNSGSQQSTNRFAVQNDAAIVDTFNTAELGTLDDVDDRAVNWDVDESLDVDSVIKQAKMKERLERTEKHKQKKQEKLQSSAGGKLLEAVKIS